ncbi:MAG: DNA/RNA nuclease SfsA [Thermosipho sp. (in: Bacteria)]|nr:DNA/RNA nuclease SfsA [Thermosipho sp. (in: thermotogales)]
MKLLKIPFSKKGIFLERTNKYLGKIKVNKEIIETHIHDPGRLNKLLYSGNEVLINYVESKTRKTSYDLIAAKKDSEWIIVNSMYHRKISEAILKSKIIFTNREDIIFIKPEVKFDQSRLDYLIKTKEFTALLEVKGCTLSTDGIALFPDAPTKRGTKHLNELIKAQKLGFKAILLILVFPNSHCFSPNNFIDKNFSKIFYEALDKFVEVIPVQLFYSKSTQHVYFKKILPLCL